MSWIKVIAINLLIFLIGLGALEFGVRLWLTQQDCDIGLCDKRRLTTLKINQIDRSTSVGLSQIDSMLGYTTRPGFDAAMTMPGWAGQQLTIDAEGFRSNGPNNNVGPHARHWLAVGDSFTFGDQVGNHETWPACLEQQSGARIVNAGVFGYGAAQALKRAQILIEKKHYDGVIWSVLVGNDFARDRLNYRGGFAVPAVIRQTDGQLGWAPPPDPLAWGTKYNPRDHAALLWLFEYSSLAVHLAQKYDIDMSGSRRNSPHPNAADTADIIRWSLDEFKTMPIAHKILLLQYGEVMDDPVMRDERAFLLDEAAKRAITTVDTFPLLLGKDPKDYWFGHHTVAGNHLVCQALMPAIKPAR